MNFHGKSILVFGLGRSGLAAARLLLREGADVTLWDQGTGADVEKSAGMVRDLGCSCLTGEAWQRDQTNYALAILSPGIPTEAEAVQKVIRQGTPVWSEIELASHFTTMPIVAITGTNGKTTTTLLIEAILNAAGASTKACGNIGLPVSEVLLQGARLDVLTIEVSSFQLETIQNFRPKAAVWTNFSANHLDRYTSVEDYRRAKERLFENQTGTDFAIVNARESSLPGRACVWRFAADLPEADLHFEQDQIIFQRRTVGTLRNPQLQGFHNRENVLAATGACLAVGVEPSEALAALDDFTPPDHRCREVARHDGVVYINDSKSTNLDATAKALMSYQQPIILILGGKNKGFGFAPLLPLVRERVRHTVAVGEMKNSIASDWSDTPCSIAEDVEHAVEMARQFALAGDVVLFSPGTSSFDMFSGYEERGRAFSSAVSRSLEKGKTLTPPRTTQAA